MASSRKTNYCITVFIKKANENAVVNHFYRYAEAKKLIVHTHRFEAIAAFG